MATRSTRFITKNSDIVNRPLPSTLLGGEAIVNTADGIVWYSGVTTSTNEWTPAGTGTTANFFEVGSNLYDLKIRNKITAYEDISGAGLVGKFLSGTTNGFVLADISSITGVDSFVTGGTYNGTNLVLNLNEGQPSVTITGITDTNDYTTSATLIGSVAYFNRTDAASAYTLDLSTFVYTGDTFTTGFTYDNANNLTIERNNGQSSLSVNINTMTGLTVNGTLLATTISATTYQGLPTDVHVVGGSYNSGTGDIDFINNTGGTFVVSGLSTDLDTYVTGGTIGSSATDNSNAGTIDLDYTNDEGGSYTLPFENTYISGGTLSGTNLLLDKNDGVQETIDLSALDNADTYVTGVTYNNSLLTVSQNEGQADLTAIIDEVSGLTVSNLTAGRVVYVGTGGVLTDEAGFTYNDSTNTLSTPVDGTMEVGTGGLTVGGDAVIQGSLTVYGASVSAFTSDLYVEDNNVFLNYNPTGNTASASIGAGWTIQDGNGISGDTNLNINRLDTLTGLTAGNVPDVTEYTGGTGYENRDWVTQLNDIVIRSTNVGTPNGVRVLGEFDTLDGGSY